MIQDPVVADTVAKIRKARIDAAVAKVTGAKPDAAPDFKDYPPDTSDDPFAPGFGDDLPPRQRGTREQPVLNPRQQRDPTLVQSGVEAVKGALSTAGEGFSLLGDAFVDAVTGPRIDASTTAAEKKRIQEGRAKTQQERQGVREMYAKDSALAPNPELKRGAGRQVGEVAGSVVPYFASAVVGPEGPVTLAMLQGGLVGYYNAIASNAPPEKAWTNAIGLMGVAGGTMVVAQPAELLGKILANTGPKMSQALGASVMGGSAMTAQAGLSETLSQHLLKNPEDRNSAEEIWKQAATEGGLPIFWLGVLGGALHAVTIKETVAKAQQPKGGGLTQEARMGEPAPVAPEPFPEPTAAREVAPATREPQTSPDLTAALQAQPEPTAAPAPAFVETQATPSETGAAVPKNAAAPTPEAGGPTAQEQTPPSAGGEAAAPAQPGDAIGIKRASLEKQAAELGLKEPEKPLSVSDKDRHARASQVSPEDRRALVDELEADPERRATEDETMVLALEVADRFTKAERATKDYNADPTPVKLAEADRLGADYDQASQQLRRVGSLRGAGLRLMKTMIARDMSLAAMEQKMRSTQGGEPLSADQHKQLAETQAKWQEAESRYQELLSKHQEAAAAAELKDAAQQAEIALLRTKKTRAPAREVKIAKSKARFDEIVRELATRGKNRTAGGLPIDPYDIKLVGEAALHAAKIGYHEFAGWAEHMAKNAGEWVRPHLQAAWDAAQKAKRDELAGGLKQSLSEGGKLAEHGRAIDKIVRGFAEDGITDLGEMVRAVHEVLKEADPNITLREAHDAVTHYGRFKPLSTDEVSATVRRIRGEGREIAKLADIAERNPPKATGFEFPKAEERQRALGKKVREGMKKLGIKTTDEATQIKSTLDSLKTRARNEIEDLQYALDRGEKMSGKEKVKLTDPELESLRTQLEARRSEYEAAFKGDNDLIRVANARASVEKSIADYERRIVEGDIARKKGTPGPSSQELEMLKARREALQAELEMLRRIANPAKTLEQRAIQARKTSILNANARMKERLFYAEFEEPSPRTRKEQPALSPELEKAKAETEAGAAKLRQQIERNRIKNLPRAQKIARTLVKLSRAAVLSSPAVVEKLAAAGTWRVLARTAQEAVGAGLARAPFTGEAMARAPHEGGTTRASETAAYTKGILAGAKEAWQNLKNKPGPRELAFGKPQVEERTPLDWLGSVHQALHQIPVQMEFERLMVKGVEWAKSQGLDTSDPLVLMRIGADSYEGAQRETLLQYNRLVKAWRGGLARLEQPNKATGEVPTLGTIGANTGRFLVPVDTIPTNAVAEAFSYIVGDAYGSAKLAKAFKDGINNLKPAEADAIARNLKKGLVGKAAMLAGWFLYESLGGYYRGQKKDDIQPSEAKVMGVEVDQHFLHSPFLEAMQFAANAHHVLNQRKNNSLPEALGASAMGLVKEAPYAREVVDVGRMIDSTNATEAVGSMLGGRVVPQASFWLARLLDPERRKAAGFLETVQSGIPGLRQELPRKK